MGVRANADTGPDAEKALEFGAAGIGLCRTEHMFFGDERITKMRRMMSETVQKEAFEALRPLQREDFREIFRAMDGYPVTVRLLDPPLHEFLPTDPDDQAELAERLDLSAKAIAGKVKALDEFNPMLGHRGCRLGVTRPEITKMQAQVLFEAVLDVQADFFSFGTNDLTQMTFGFSRDDAGPFFPYYIDEGLLERDSI